MTIRINLDENDFEALAAGVSVTKKHDVNTVEIIRAPRGPIYTRIETAVGFTPFDTVEGMLDDSDLKNIELAKALVFDEQQLGDMLVKVTVTIKIEPVIE